MSKNQDEGAVVVSPRVIRFLDELAFATPPDLKFEDVPLPEFGEGAGIRIMELDAEEAQKFGEIVSKQADKFAMPLWIIACARRVKDDGTTGDRLFEDSPETRQKLLKLGASILMRLGDCALKLNGFSKDETEKDAKK